MIGFAKIRKRVLRNGSEWAEISAVKEDKTRSGKPKRMLYASMGSRQFTVRMRLTHAEYLIFTEWYNKECFKGLVSFAFPVIDSLNRVAEREYRFVSGTAPRYSNPGGKLIDCSMQWEEV